MIKKKKEYSTGKLPKLWEYLIWLFENDKDAFRSPEYLSFVVGHKWKALENKKRCPNCNASMRIDCYKPDMLDMILLLSMGEAVKERLALGMSFTEANMIDVSSLPVSNSVKCRTTRSSYLNYIKQPLEKKQSGDWLITTWGWKVLRDETVPKIVKYFRGVLVEDSRSGSISISQLFSRHKNKVENALKEKKIPKTDYRNWINNYDPKDWNY